MNGTVCLSGVAGLVTGCLDLMNTCRCAYDWFVRLCGCWFRESVVVVVCMVMV